MDDTLIRSIIQDGKLLNTRFNDHGFFAALTLNNALYELRIDHKLRSIIGLRQISNDQLVGSYRDLSAKELLVRESVVEEAFNKFLTSTPLDRRKASEP
jgi:hypothetical protein